MRASLQPKPDDPKAAAVKRGGAHAIGAASGMPLFLGACVQRKLPVGPPNDVFEQLTDAFSKLSEAPDLKALLWVRLEYLRLGIK